MRNIILSTLALLFACGCTHPLRITSSPKLSSWEVELSSDLALGFTPSEDVLVKAVIEDMLYHPGVESVKRNCRPGSRQSEAVDRICSLKRTMTAKASGENFAIAFPGFLVFAHSWLGYRYHIDIETESTIMSPDGNVLSRTSILAPYDIRYTSFQRGASASTGWYTPGYGILTAIPGAIFASTYDPRATSELLRQAEPSYKRFVSQKVIEQLRNVGVRRSGSVSQIRAAGPVVLEMGGDDKASLAYGQRHYAISVARTDGRLATVVREDVVELSPENAALMKRLWMGDETIAPENLRTIMAALSLSDIPVPDDIAKVDAYTMKGDQFVTLVPGRGQNEALAAAILDAR
jgi:hypothetical protein